MNRFNKDSRHDLPARAREMDKDSDHYTLQSQKRYCPRCASQLKYLSLGDYVCPNCGHKEKDDYGKVREFIDENGPCSAYVIHMSTGVSQEVINDFIKKGKLEVTDDSPVYLKCEECGADIKYGRLCPNCAKSKVSKIKGYLVQDVGEVPKTKSKSNEKMRFIGKNKHDS